MSKKPEQTSSNIAQNKKARHDYFIEDTDNIPDMATVKNPVIKMVMEWCTDDNGLNLLYKKNGDERYPDFKLYKMIARRVHNHSPTKQLERTEFKQFLITELPTKKKDCWIVNIDKIGFWQGTTKKNNTF